MQVRQVEAGLEINQLFSLKEDVNVLEQIGSDHRHTIESSDTRVDNFVNGLDSVAHSVKKHHVTVARFHHAIETIVDDVPGKTNKNHDTIESPSDGNGMNHIETGLF